jgi:hypothetical protein
MERGRTLTLRPAAEVGAGDSGHLRRLNLQRVLAVVMSQAGPFTRGEIIEATGTSAPTIGAWSVTSYAPVSSATWARVPRAAGRRPRSMEFNARHGFVGAIDIGPTRTRLAVGDLKGERLAHDVDADAVGLAPRTILAHLAASLRSLCARRRRRRSACSRSWRAPREP